MCILFLDSPRQSTHTNLPLSHPPGPSFSLSLAGRKAPKDKIQALTTTPPSTSLEKQHVPPSLSVSPTTPVMLNRKSSSRRPSLFYLGVGLPALIVGLFFSGMYYHFKVSDAPYSHAIIQGHVSDVTSTIWVRNVDAASFVLLGRAKSSVESPAACLAAALDAREPARPPARQQPSMEAAGGGGEKKDNDLSSSSTVRHENENSAVHHDDDRAFRTPSTDLLDGSDNIATVTVRDLRPSTCYLYRAIFTSKNQHTSDDEMRSQSTTTRPSSSTQSMVHSFFTPPQVHKPTPSMNVLFGSCISRTFFRPFDKLSIFSSILARHAPSLSLILGDVAYVDLHESLPYFRSTLARVFRSTWSDPSLWSFSGLVPTYLQRDDHEVYNDHVGPLPAGTAAPWKTYVADRHPTFVDASTGDSDPDVLYYHFSYGKDVSVFVLDMRSHTTEDAVLGPLQFSRLQSWLHSRPPNSLKVIAAPMMFSSVPSMAAPFEDKPSEKDELKKFIALHRICGVVVLSGDTHWGGAWDLMEGGGLIEFAASPFQALPFPGSPFFGGRGNGEGEKKLFFSSFGYHYGILNFETGSNREGGEWKAAAQIYKFWPWHKEATLVYEKELRLVDMCPA